MVDVDGFAAACAGGGGGVSSGLNITFVLPHANLSGGTRVVAVYARKLTERGHRVCVISGPIPKPSLHDRLRALLRGKGPLPWGGGEPSHLDGVPVEHRLLDRQRPLRDSDVPDADVIIATWWETAEWIMPLRASKGVKAYFIQHDETVFFPPNASEGRQRVEATWRLPVCKFAVARWLSELGVERGSGEPITVVPNAVDHDVFHAPARGKQPQPTVGFMYSTTRFKGCDIALAAIRLARERIPGLRVQAFGLDAPSDAMPMPPGSQFSKRPPQDRLRTIYSSCDAWLFSSRSEGFGLPILEAMACRTPVVATPAGPAPDLIGAGGGVLVRHDDPADMARALADVCIMPETPWRALSDAACATAARFTWDQSTTLLEQTLRRAVAGTSAPRPAQPQLS